MCKRLRACNLGQSDNRVPAGESGCPSKCYLRQLCDTSRSRLPRAFSSIRTLYARAQHYEQGRAFSIQFSVFFIFVWPACRSHSGKSWVTTFASTSVFGKPWKKQFLPFRRRSTTPGQRAWICGNGYWLPVRYPSWRNFTTSSTLSHQI